MENRQDNRRCIAAGFSFYTEKDAALAESEQKKVEYLETHLDYDKPETILRVYNKAIEERIFKSPVGLLFLKELQSYLRDRPEIDEEQIGVIPVFASFDGEIREQTNPAKTRVKPAKVKEEKKLNLLPVSVLLNIGLVAAVIAMFAIALNSSQPNILNYEKAITNRYASWEQQLTEREKTVRERERELNLSGDL